MYCRAKSLNLTQINFAQIIPTDKKPEVIQDEITKLRFCCAACYKKAMDSYFTTFREGSTSSKFQKIRFDAKIASSKWLLFLIVSFKATDTTQISGKWLQFRNIEDWILRNKEVVVILSRKNGTFGLLFDGRFSLPFSLLL